jgi:hypothetical protein
MCDHCDHAFEHTQCRLDSALSTLRLNHSPEGVAADEILRVIDAIDSHFGRYDPEISRVQRILASLQEQRRTLHTYQAYCRSILSPIRKLPPEILETIFLACMGPEPDIIPVVGQVCSHWRNIVIGTPTLWSNISIGRTRFRFNQRYVNLASLFLKRSASRPLSVTVRYPADARLVGLLVRHANRWGTLRLSTSFREFYDSLGLTAHTFPMLERLEIMEANAEPAEPSQEPVLLNNAPNLKDVVLKNPLVFWTLPWSHLTRLQYDVNAVVDAVRILHLCPRLVECSFDKLIFAAADTDIIADLRPLRKLRSLRLSVNSVSAQPILKTLFDSLTAPKLVSLEIIGQWTPSDLTEFLARSQCKLASLILSTGYMKDEKILDVLQTLPHLDKLVLDADTGTSRQLQNRVITDKLLRRLIFYPDSDCVLPSLTHLTLKTAVNFEDQVLLDLIESRWIPWVTQLYGCPCSRLTRIDLEFWGKKDRIDPSSVEELKDFAAAGLQLSLQQGGEKISMVSSDDSRPS